MKRVPLHGAPQRFITVEEGATKGATIGVDLKWSDGKPVSEAEIRKALEPVEVETVAPVAGYTDAQADQRVAGGIAVHKADADAHPQYMKKSDALSGGILPLVTGAIVSGQPQFVYASDGTLIYARVA